MNKKDLYVTAALMIKMGALIAGEYSEISKSGDFPGPLQHRLAEAYASLLVAYKNFLKENPGLDTPSADVYHQIPYLGGIYDKEEIIAISLGTPYMPEEEIAYCGGVAPDSWANTIAMLEGEAFRCGVKSIPKTPVDEGCKKAYLNAEKALNDTAINIELANINEYSLSWKPEDGKVIMNGVLELAKVNFGSQAYRLMKCIFSYLGNEEKCSFEFSGNATAKSTAQTLCEGLHITPIMKKIFFRGSKKDHICFRSPVQKTTLIKEGVNKEDLYNLDRSIVEAKLVKIDCG